MPQGFLRSGKIQLDHRAVSWLYSEDNNDKHLLRLLEGQIEPHSCQCTTYQNNTIEALLEPRNSVLLLHAMLESDSRPFAFPPRYPCTRASHNNVEVHAKYTDMRVVSCTEINMLLDSKAKVASLREIALSQFVFLDFEPSL